MNKPFTDLQAECKTEEIMPKENLLTEDELKAIDLLADFYNLCATTIVGKEHIADMTEIVHHVHILQRTIMAQAAKRAYPDRFRMLGKINK